MFGVQAGGHFRHLSEFCSMAGRVQPFDLGFMGCPAAVGCGWALAERLYEFGYLLGRQDKNASCTDVNWHGQWPFLSPLHSYGF